MKKLLNLLTLFIFIGCIQAETSEQTVYRSEFMFCTMSESCKESPHESINKQRYSCFVYLNVSLSSLSSLGRIERSSKILPEKLYQQKNIRNLSKVIHCSIDSS